MTYTTETQTDGTTRLTLDFSDEGVELQVTETVSGDESAALGRLRFLEADARQNFRTMFPVPEPTEPAEMEMI